MSGPVLQRADDRGRADLGADRGLHRHHPEEEAEEGEVRRGRQRGGVPRGELHPPRPRHRDTRPAPDPQESQARLARQARAAAELWRWVVKDHHSWHFLLFSFIFSFFAAQDVMHNSHQMSKNAIYTNGSQNGGFDSGVGFIILLFLSLFTNTHLTLSIYPKPNTVLEKSEDLRFDSLYFVF